MFDLSSDQLSYFSGPFLAIEWVSLPILFNEYKHRIVRRREIIIAMIMQSIVLLVAVAYHCGENTALTIVWWSRNHMEIPPWWGMRQNLTISWWMSTYWTVSATEKHEFEGYLFLPMKADSRPDWLFYEHKFSSQSPIQPGYKKQHTLKFPSSPLCMWNNLMDPRGRKRRSMANNNRMSQRSIVYQTSLWSSWNSSVLRLYCTVDCSLLPCLYVRTVWYLSMACSAVNSKRARRTV